MRLQFRGKPGVTYRVQGAGSLEGGQWRDLGTVPGSAEGRLEFADPETATHPSRYYRVAE